MKKIFYLFFIILTIYPSNALAIHLTRNFITKDQFTISSLLYNTIQKTLYYITPHGKILIINPESKKIFETINLGNNNELYDYDIVSEIDNKSGFIYISFNRTLYVLDASTNKIKNKISLINNPDKIIPKNGSSKIWIFYSDFGLIGSINDALESNVKKNKVEYERYVKRPSDVIYDSYNDRLYLINSDLKHIYSVDNNNKIIATLDYRKQLKLIKDKHIEFNFVSDLGFPEKIQIEQLKPGWQNKQFSLDNDTGKLYIPLNNSFLVFNTRNNSFENSINNVFPYKKIFSTDGKLFIFFEIGNTGYDGIVIVDEKTRKIFDVAILDKIDEITIAPENKKLYAICSFSRLNYSSLITFDYSENTPDKMTYLKQLDQLTKDIKSISISSKDFRILDFYEDIKPDIEIIRSTILEKENYKNCSSLLGVSINTHIKPHLKHFISPCYSPTDRSKSCLIFHRLTEIINYLSAIIALDINQNNISDICERFN